MGIGEPGNLEFPVLRNVYKISYKLYGYQLNTHIISHLWFAFGVYFM